MGVDRTNDFAFKIATVNGTGSASANGLIMQAIFRMGIPGHRQERLSVQYPGLATWYEIRVSRGRIHRPHAGLRPARGHEPGTYDRDIEEVRSGGYLLYDSSWPLDESRMREDVTFLGVPLGKMCVESFKGARERILMKNIGYAGALAALLSMDMDVIRSMLEEKFSRKPALIDSNFTAIELGYDYAKEHFDCPLPIHLESTDATGDHILIDGNTSAGLGCVYAGATVGAWYPITPSTSLMDGFSAFCERFRKDPETGKRRFLIVQAEDELAAAGVVVGAGWAGARAFTPTSGPGISLMSEFIGLAYYAEIPSVFVDVQRTGPSTGMPTRTQQGDLMMIAYASHGDTKHIAIFPANPTESFYFAVEAFDLAERFQTPVFLVQDLDIGMNDWMIPKLEWDDAYVPDRGKVLSAEELEDIEKFYRYLDVDGDRDPLSHPARRTSEGSVLHARIRTHQARHVHGRLRRVRRGGGPVASQGGLGRERGARAYHLKGRGRHDVDRHDRQLRRSGARGHRPPGRPGDVLRLHARPWLPLRREREGVSTVS